MTLSEQLAEQVQARRIARGKEPLRLSHIMRAVRFVWGCRPPAQRCPHFQVKKRVIHPDVTRGGALRLRRVYMRAARGRAA